MRYLIGIPWHPPQEIDVRKVGCIFTFSFCDRLGRRRVVEGATLPYAVTLFASRVPQDVTRFVVYGDWQSATYRAFDGEESPVLIYGIR